MNIYAKKGDRVIFSHPKAGYYYDQRTASKYLKLGEIYCRMYLCKWFFN